MELNIWLFINIISEASNDYSDNMSEHISMAEFETEPNESDELFFDGENTDMVDSHSQQDNITSQSKNNTLFTFKLSLVYNKLCFN